MFSRNKPDKEECSLEKGYGVGDSKASITLNTPIDVLGIALPLSSQLPTHLLGKNHNC